MNRTNIVWGEKELLEVPLPQETDSYKPISHEFLINETRHKLNNLGFSIENTKYTACSNGQIMTCYMDISNPAMENDTLGMRIAFQNSYNKSVTVKYVTGAVVFVCTNSAAFGAVKLVRKHTGSVLEHLNEHMDECFSYIGNQYDKAIHDMNYLRSNLIDLKKAGQILGELYLAEEIITPTQVSEIARQIQKNKDFGFSNNYGTAWDLYNCITETFKNQIRPKALNDLSRLHLFFEESFIPESDRINYSEFELVIDEQVMENYD